MRRSIIPTIAWILLAAPTLAAEPDGLATTLDQLLDVRLSADEPYRIVELSEAILYVRFGSGETRRAVFEGIAEAAIAEAAAPLPLTLSRHSLADAYREAAGTLQGIAAAFREDLAKTGFLQPLDGSLDRALVTTVEPTAPGAHSELSFSERLEEVTERREKRDRLEGDNDAETTSLKVFGPDHPAAREAYDAWRFDGLPDLLEAGEKREAERARRLAIERARLASELIHALLYVDPAYGGAVARWIENDLEQAEVNLLAQLLQLAGYRDMSPRVLIAESAPHLFEPSVLTAKLFQGLGRVTVPARRRGERRLDPQQFPERQLRERAEAFYGRFFAGGGKGGYRLELRDEIRGFIERESAAVQRLSAPFLDRYLIAPPPRPIAG